MTHAKWSQWTQYGLKTGSVIAILIATDISLIAWLAQNYGKTNPLLLKVGLTIALLVTLVIVWINKAAYRKIDKLEEL